MSALEASKQPDYVVIRPARAVRLAVRLTQSLHQLGIRADYFTYAGVSHVNVWRHGSQQDRYPAASVIINDNFPDVVWGTHFEHQLPITTAPDEIAAAVLAALPD